MRIGYPCSNLALRDSASRTFRLASYSEERLIETIDANLHALSRYLEWNDEHDLRFFRISSNTVPFASHPIMTFAWQTHVADQLASIGRFVRDHGMRINVHPGQYTLLNAERHEVREQSVAELVYHAELLDLMGLDATHKIQIHVGGTYNDKPAAMDRFCEVHATLPEAVQRRLVIENDERQYSLADALELHDRTGIPVLFDVFHHRLFNTGEELDDALDRSFATWRDHGGPMMDYSSQDPDKQPGAHTRSIDLEDFGRFVEVLGDRDVDIMLEIKDKEGSALQALDLLRQRGLVPA